MCPFFGYILLEYKVAFYIVVFIFHVLSLILSVPLEPLIGLTSSRLYT